MNDVLIHQFIQLISTNTGLHIREQDQKALCNKISTRMKLLNLSEPDQYYQLLKTGSEQKNSPRETIGKLEWKELTLLLTTGETYFFRDQGQISLLKNRILPELIAHKNQAQGAAGETQRSLRIWSAGCSTGEEPYTLAMLVKELIPDCDKWNILILGTDINPEPIEKAKQGIYNSWSFRMVAPELQRRYFYQLKTGWEVERQIREMVTFRSGNLIQDRFPCFASDIHSMDLILCRNVFIYFDPKSISLVLQKFHKTLKPGGYLIAGHTELQGQNLGYLQAKVFPESVAYQRSEEANTEQGALNRGVQKELGESKGLSSSVQIITLGIGEAAPRSSRSQAVGAGLKPAPTENKIIKALPRFGTGARSELTKENLTDKIPQSVLSQAEKLLHNGAYALAIREAEQVIKQHPNHFDAYYLMAQALANLGECEKAIHCCGQALKLNSLSVAPYYLLAHIAEEQGNIDKAKNSLKKIIYLAPSSIAAYLELGSLYEREGDATRARKMRNSAFELLKELPSHTTVEHYGEVTAGELFLQVRKLLKNHT